ncbi:MAG: hypothetical protein IPO09_18795 [Anaeromyxobacter sp.]|nr:hypothetical protein [Anaeromyxobacter sp.]
MTFLAWGALHGVMLAASVYHLPYKARLDRQVGPRLAGVLRLWRIAVVFNLVCLTWIFFRAQSLEDAWTVLTGIAATDWSSSLQAGVRAAMAKALPGLTPRDAVIASGGLVVVLLEPVLRRRPLGAMRLPARWLTYGGLVTTILLLGRWGEQTFIYFNF